MQCSSSTKGKAKITRAKERATIKVEERTGGPIFHPGLGENLEENPRENTKGNPKARAKEKQRVSMDRRLAKVKDSCNKGAESVVSLDIGGMSALNVCEK